MTKNFGFRVSFGYWLDLAVLGCTGRYWAVLECTGWYWAALGCSWLHWDVLGGTGLNWAVLGGTGLYWAVLGGTGPVLKIDYPGYRGRRTKKLEDQTTWEDKQN